MKNLTYVLVIIASLIVFYAVFPRIAYAYINPGAGTYIVQLLIAALVGGTTAVKLYWNKIKTLFKKNKIQK